MFEHLRNCLFRRIFFFLGENKWEKRHLERSEQNGQNGLSCNHSLQLEWTIKHLRMCWTLRWIGYNSERTHWILIFLPINRNPSFHWEQAHPPKKWWCGVMKLDKQEKTQSWIFFESHTTDWLLSLACLLIEHKSIQFKKSSFVLNNVFYRAG